MPSTLIRAFSYDPNTATLEIVFVSGAIYHYIEVPAEVVARMRGAFAKGEFFNQHIRGQFSFGRMTPADPRAQGAKVRKVSE